MFLSLIEMKEVRICNGLNDATHILSYLSGKRIDSTLLQWQKKAKIKFVCDTGPHKTTTLDLAIRQLCILIIILYGIYHSPTE